MTHASRPPVFFPRLRWLQAAATHPLVFLLAALLLPCLPALALPPQKLLMAPPSVSALHGELFLNLSLTVDNEDGLRDLLKDGAVLRLRVSVTLVRKRPWWTDETVAEREYDSIIRHDPLSRDFELSFPAPDGVENLRDRNLTRLLHSSWRKLSLPVLPLRALYARGNDENFDIIITVTLQHTEVPPWLEKSSLFWSSDVVPQEKHTLSFYLPTNAP